MMGGALMKKLAALLYSESGTSSTVTEPFLVLVPFVDGLVLAFFLGASSSSTTSSCF